MEGLPLRRIDTIGYHGMNTSRLLFDGHEGQKENLLGGKAGIAFRHSKVSYERARTRFSFRCILLARAAYETALQYSRHWVQFGQPICNFHWIRYKVADMAMRVCGEAVQTLGNNRFAVEMPVNRYWRDSRLCTIGEDNSEIQRKVIARRLLGKR